MPQASAEVLAALGIWTLDLWVRGFEVSGSGFVLKCFFGCSGDVGFVFLSSGHYRASGMVCLFLGGALGETVGLHGGLAALFGSDLTI